MRALSAGIPDPYLASIPAAMLPKLMASGSSTSHAVAKPAGGRKARHSVERRTVSQVTTSHMRPPPCVCGAGTAVLPLVLMRRCLCFHALLQPTLASRPLTSPVRFGDDPVTGSASAVPADAGTDCIPVPLHFVAAMLTCLCFARVSAKVLWQLLAPVSIGQES